jgi:hypothetical protein
MDVLNLSLLAAAALPPAVVLGLNAWLALNGERGTLLVPTAARYECLSCPTLVLSAVAKAQAAQVEVANDDYARKAA